MTAVPLIQPGGPRRLRICIVQQAVWRTSGRASMPLAAGYLKAMVETDPTLHGDCTVSIANFSGRESVAEIIQAVLDHAPDLLCFSVLGWNYQTFGQVATTYKQLRPDGWVIWGGNHVAYQARRVFTEWPAVDAVVNGEGEFTFRELVCAALDRQPTSALDRIGGISYRAPDGTVTTTPDRPRIDDLDVIPSPFLTGAIDLTDAAGDFAYDYALLETNRGCPYACAFCYWGGAIGQKVRSFSIDRLRAEVELLARLKAPSIVLCDANFGMLHADEAFAEICISARERFGAPHSLVTSWAKNKGRLFYRIVRSMKQHGLHSAFNLALQSLDDTVLDAMGRKNMAINNWENLAQWLRSEDLDMYAELIWGCPGETVESFLEGYDRLARHVTRIAIYPHLIMPNTRYSDERERHGLITWRTGEHDFELVLAHRTMSIADNRRMHRFLFWARVIAEHLYFRVIWGPLAQLANVTQSRVLLLLDCWIDGQVEDALALELNRLRDRAVTSLEVSSVLVEEALQALYSSETAATLLTRWWREAVIPLVPSHLVAFFTELFRFDLLLLPIYPASPDAARLDQTVRDGTTVYLRPAERFTYAVPKIIAVMRRGETPDIVPEPALYAVTYRTGFCNDMQLYHNTHNLEYFGQVVRCGPVAADAHRSAGEAA
jgi:radical SAM superfamily enzyme YgiQ (UPF0313 family)